MSNQLNWGTINQIRKDYAAGNSQKFLCEKYGVKNGAMSKIITGKSWQQETTKKTIYSAFGESKEISEWLKDPRCVVNQFTLDYRMRIKKLDLETALTMSADRGKRWKDGEQQSYTRTGEKNRWKK